jgi:hypothetical protein
MSRKSDGQQDESEFPDDFHVQKLNDDYHNKKLKLAEKFLLKKAQDGSLWAIRNLLLMTADALEDGARLSSGIAAYLSDAFRQIHDGRTADDALGIKRARGEKDNRKARQRAGIYTECVERLRILHGLTLENAIVEVANRFDANEDTVKRAWKLNYRETRREIELEQKFFGEVKPILWGIKT